MQEFGLWVSKTVTPATFLSRSQPMATASLRNVWPRSRADAHGSNLSSWP
jgi:hypothetical protein